MVEKVEEQARDVVFRDVTADEEFIVSSTIEAEQTTEIDGEEYPLREVEVSSASHPFYTGEQKLVDTEGRVERFERKYGEVGSSDEEGEEAEEAEE